jgi:hypothetical protein
MMERMTDIQKIKTVEGNHLSVKYYDALCELGAQMRNLKSLEAGS